jgi:D-alanyl-lipoteichoic acid acyltransferase DltB (MBOAT superfamily)
MLFNSLQFLCFFIIVCPVYFILPLKLRWLWLLLVSCYFYAVLNPYYLCILGAAILIDYTCGLGLHYAQNLPIRKGILALSILSNIAILGYFKYHNFFLENLRHVPGLSGINQTFDYLSIALPIGLSFHTFQSMSYCIEVYRNPQAVEKNPFVFSLFVMFFPQLVAGPIERPYRLLRQFHILQAFSSQNVKSGLLLMAWGLIKKAVISDRLAIYVNEVYAAPNAFSSVGLVLAALFFSFQIYCDFSGYSDMARGAAKVLGYDLMVNFNLPYLARSLKDFWSRWHISLSGWFRDYLYIPLGGSKVSAGRYAFNILLVFLVSGFWHGANWTFIIWGLLHGFALLLSARMPLISLQKHTFGYGPHIATFVFVTLSWIFFRAESVPHALNFLTGIFSFRSGELTHLLFSASHIVIALSLIGMLLWIERSRLNEVLHTRHFYTKSFIMVCILYFLGLYHQSQFIYFQF